MKQLKKRSTTIHEDVRRMLGISRDIYAFCAYIHYRCADSRQKRSGWCCDNKQDIADFVGVTRPGLYKMAERLQEIGLIQISNSGDYRATPKWVDADVNCKQNLQNSATKTVNKVDKNCKQSLQIKADSVNKVDKDTLYRELDIKLEGVGGETHAPAENQIPETSEEKNTPLPKVAPKGFAPAAAPTHAVTTHDPAAPGIVTVDPVTLPMSEAAAPPRRAATLLDAEKKIVDWILGDGLETVKHRHHVAKIKFEPADAEVIAAHYGSIYTSTNPGSKAAFMADPVAHFENGLFKYLKNEQSFSRSTPKQNQNQPTRNQNAPARSNIQHLGGEDQAKYFQ